MVSYAFVLLTVMSTVASQVLFKFGVREMAIEGASIYSLGSLFNLHVLGGLMFSVTSIVSWLIAISKLNLSVAYPFMSLTFPMVLLCSGLFFGEHISFMRWIGIFFIMGGLVLIGRSA